jgi:hypothetical protein
VSATRPGRHARDPSVPPPVDPELTRLSARWTHRALRTTIAVWVVAGLVGAFYDALSRYGHLTWILVWGRGGAGFVWQLHVPKGRLAAFALIMTGAAMISSLIGASRMFTAARTGRPHHGPSLWSIVGAVLAVVLGSNVVGCFVLSDIFSPSSDAVLVAGFAPQMLGLLGGLVFGNVVRTRYNPWTWADRRGRPAPDSRQDRRPGARVMTVELDPATAVLTATYADGARYQYAGVSEHEHELISASPRIDQVEFLGRIARTKSFRRLGEDAWRSAPSTAEIGFPPVDWARWAQDFLLGECPPPGTAHLRAPRATRAAARRVEVTPAGVTWRTLVGRSGHIPAAHVGAVRLAEVEFSGNTTVLYPYALVLDHDGAALLRVSASSGSSVSAAEGRRRLRQMWDPLGVPVTPHSSALSRAKDLRRRWPEAFPWARAYPLVTAWIAAALWMGVVVPILDHLFGP